MKNFFLGIVLLQFTGSTMLAQVSITPDNSAPDNSAMFDVKSTNKGILIPRMTQAEIEAIVNPANGLVVFCTTYDKFFVYLSSQNKWKEISYGPNNIIPGGGFSCNNSIPINHLASGGIAPVNKTVTYGTVTNIPGEPTKCWITSNLGSDHQATAVDDVTEASAGWYWQFNRKQGFKHDGTTRTPNSAWIASINETLDWQAANDPCTLELGSSWRIPTTTEWTNVDATGNWTNPNGPWNSDLKMHGAVLLTESDGSLAGRGTNGLYWSSTASNTTMGWGLYFWTSYCFIYDYNKSYGFSIRCVRE